MNTRGSWNIKIHRPEPHFKSSKFFQHNLLANVDAFTREHSFRVQNIAMKLGVILQLPHEEITHLGTAALFHDIGKMAIKKFPSSTPTKYLSTIFSGKNFQNKRPFQSP